MKKRENKKILKKEGLGYIVCDSVWQGKFNLSPTTTVAGIKKQQVTLKNTGDKNTDG